jgi:dephospho-CoA kinase
MLIGFTGPMRAGKTTAAMHLVISRGFIRCSFAQPVRRECAMMLATLEGESYPRLEEEMRADASKEKFRGLLQWYGIYRRMNDPEHWVRNMKRRLDIMLARDYSICIDDVRFENEAAMIHRLGGKVVLIDSAAAPMSDHESEREWQTMPVDYTLFNDVSIEQLHQDIDEMMEDLA